MGAVYLAQMADQQIKVTSPFRVAAEGDFKQGLGQRFALVPIVDANLQIGPFDANRQASDAGFPIGREKPDIGGAFGAHSVLRGISPQTR